jgi:hypothetical protein
METMMDNGQLIAVRGQGMRQVRLLFETAVDGVDYGVVEQADGTRATPAPIAAILARGYWRKPQDPVVVKFAPGLRPVLKAMSPSEAGTRAANIRWQGRRIGVHTGMRQGKTDDNPKGLVDVAGANARLIENATVLANLPDRLQADIRGGVETLGLTDEMMDANINRVLNEAVTRAGGSDPQGQEWYPEANGVAQGISNQTGLTVDQASGMIAASSVSHDWPSNQMAAEYAARAVTRKHEVQIDALTSRTRIIEGVEASYYDIARNELNGDAGRMMDGTRRRMPSPEELRGKTVDQLDPYVAAAIIKAQSQIGYDTAGIGGNGPDGRPFNNEGQSLIAPSDTSSGYGGVTYACGVQHLGRAVAIAQGADLNDVLNGHKVRSFYNNIRDPANPIDDVTVDSHAFSIALGRRVSNGSPEYNFFSGSSVKAADSWTGSAIPRKGSSETYGTSGLYSAFADAYRRVGASRTPPLSARQVQAITWTEWRIQRDEAGLPADDQGE